MAGKSPDFSRMSKQRRKELVEQIHVKSPRTKKIRELIDHCREYSKFAAEPECMLLLGGRGNGKTTECRRYEREFPMQIVEGRPTLPVLYVSIPSPTTATSLPTALLKKIGDDFWDKGNATVKTLRLCGFLDDLMTELIIMDEFHGFIDGKTDTAVLDISNWLKNFINEARKPVVLAGLPYCDVVLKANDQLERRFPVRATLDPLSRRDVKAKAYFSHFLKNVDAALPFNKRSNLADDEIAYRIFCATNGVIDFIMKIVRRAAELAIDKDIESLDSNLLARAYKERLSAIVPARPNPFTIPIEELEVKPFPTSIMGIMATNRRSKAKERKMSISETFSRS